MDITNWANQKIKKMDWIDVSLVKTGSAIFGVLLVIFVPSLIEINFLWLVGVMVLILARPFYRVYLK